MPLATSNCNGKIWVFTNNEYDITVVRDTEQQLTLNMKHQIMPCNFYTTIVYAKCSADQRLSLWNDIYQLAEDIIGPWLAGVILMW